MLEFPLVFYYNRIVLTNADVAQAVEHFIGNEEVGSSSLLISSTGDGPSEYRNSL